MKYQELNEGALQELFRSNEWSIEWDQQIGEAFRHQIRSMKVGTHRRVTIKISQDTISIIRSRIQSFFGSVTEDFDLIMHLTVELIGWSCLEQDGVR
jgi:hypothetical protein